MSTTSHAARSENILQDQDSTHTQWCYIAGVSQGNSRPLRLEEHGTQHAKVTKPKTLIKDATSAIQDVTPRPAQSTRRISEVRPDGGPKQSKSKWKLSNREPRACCFVYVPSRGPAWSRPPRSPPPPERVARSALENWPPLLAAEPPASSSSMTPHATSAAIDRGSTATRPFLPRGCPGADAASSAARGFGGGERRIRSLMSMRRGTREPCRRVLLHFVSSPPASAAAWSLVSVEKHKGVRGRDSRRGRRVVPRHERRGSGADPRG